MYELTAVSKRYGNATVGVDALKGVDLHVGDGELIAIVGPSGSGKSTMLQMLGGLDHPTAGNVVLNGQDLARMGDADLTAARRDTLGFVFQSFNLIATLSALDNVEAALVPSRVASDERRARAHAALESVGLADRVEHLPGELSGGEQQRVAIARALAGEPQVLLADEPTGNLDSSTGTEVMQLLRGLNSESGHTVVLVTHDVGVARQMGRVVEMEDGRILRDGAPV